MRIIRLLLPYLVADITALALGCARPSHRDLNVMTMPAVCDTAPPHREGSAPVIPSLAAPRAPFGAVVGAVSEVGTGLALPYATIDLARSDSAPPGRLLAADSLGGFALDTIPSGTYRLRVRSFDHRFNVRELRIAPATVETLVVALSYFQCTGY